MKVYKVDLLSASKCIINGYNKWYLVNIKEPQKLMWKWKSWERKKEWEEKSISGSINHSVNYIIVQLCY